MGSALGKINVETPKFDLLAKGDGFEVREYKPCVVAEVSYDPMKMKSGRDGGFMILAGYIGAVGEPKNKVPAKESPQKIAMTAPVITKESCAGSGSSSDGNVVIVMEGDCLVTMQFVLPSNFTMETAPQPTDPRVKVLEVPRRKYGVLGFSGGADDRVVKDQVALLKKKLEGAGYKIVGDYLLARYNPPWTPGFLKTNEVMLPVE